MNDFNFDKWAKPSNIELTLEQSLEKYIDENIGHTVFVSLEDEIIKRARAFTGVNDGSIDVLGAYRVSELTQKYWGGADEHLKWRNVISKEVFELNKMYFIGKVEGLRNAFKRDLINNGAKTCEVNEIKFSATEYVERTLKQAEDDQYYYE